MELPLAIASARKRVCQKCEDRCWRPCWKNFHCTYGIETITREVEGQECADDFWQDEASECAKGLWTRKISMAEGRVLVHGKDIGPLDTEAYRQELKARSAERAEAAQARLKEKLKAVLAHRASDADRDLALIVLTEFGAISHSLAQDAVKDLLIEQVEDADPA